MNAKTLTTWIVLLAALAAPARALTDEQSGFEAHVRGMERHSAESAQSVKLAKAENDLATLQDRLSRMKDARQTLENVPAEFAVVTLTLVPGDPKAEAQVATYEGMVKSVEDRIGYWRSQRVVVLARLAAMGPGESPDRRAALLVLDMVRVCMNDAQADSEFIHGGRTQAGAGEALLARKKAMLQDEMIPTLTRLVSLYEAEIIPAAKSGK